MVAHGVEAEVGERPRRGRRAGRGAGATPRRPPPGRRRRAASRPRRPPTAARGRARRTPARAQPALGAATIVHCTWPLERHPRGTPRPAPAGRSTVRAGSMPSKTCGSGLPVSRIEASPVGRPRVEPVGLPRGVRGERLGRRVPQRGPSYVGVVVLHPHAGGAGDVRLLGDRPGDRGVRDVGARRAPPGRAARWRRRGRRGRRRSRCGPVRGS